MRWTPELVWAMWKREKSLVPDRINTLDHSACTIHYYLIKHKDEFVPVQTTKAYRTAEVSLHSFLTLEIDQGE
jgi:hypothetical protein